LGAGLGQPQERELTQRPPGEVWLRLIKPGVLGKVGFMYQVQKQKDRVLLCQQLIVSIQFPAELVYSTIDGFFQKKGRSEWSIVVLLAITWSVTI